MASALETLRISGRHEPSWADNDLPVVLVDGKVHRIADIDTCLEGTAAYVVTINDKLMPKLCQSVRTQSIYFMEMRVKDLSPLAQLEGLSHLAIHWNTKAHDLAFLEHLTSLETLILDDTPKLNDLTPIGHLRQLSALAFSGGIWNKNRAGTLAPVGTLQHLRELELINVRIDAGGLRPLADCQSLRSLAVSNQFATEDYAYLSVRLPNVQCEHFAPYISLGRNAINGKDVMVVGKRKPFLHSDTDAKRLSGYVAKFRELQRQFAKEL